MPTWANWLIAILIIVVLVAVFIVSFVLYKKTPPPKGCEDLERNEEKCAACDEKGCRFNLYYDKDYVKKETLFKAGEDQEETAVKEKPAEESETPKEDGKDA